VQQRTAQLAAANKELEAFSFSVSHDLRAPLRTIDHFSRMVQETYGARMDPQGKSHLTRVRNASRRMTALIDDLLNLARLSFGDLKAETVDLSALAREISSDLSRTEPGRQSEFVIADGMTAEGDPGMLRILLENLLGNAWKYTGKRSMAHIDFGVSVIDGQRVFMIRDNGAGFDMEFAQKLFAPFQRFHSEKEFEGTGIGLATVQRIINRHAGKVWVESDIAVGTKVSWTLGG
jgi:light-regulated signal transduction histidine kinase (bacteriophytochrome)